MECKNCGAEVGIEYRLCPYCRTEIEHTNNTQANNSQPVIVVQNVLNNQNADPNAFNNSFDPLAALSSPKSKTVALMLSIFLGYLGIHRFYVGKVGSAILYFLTAGLFCFGWIYDIIKIASGTFSDGRGLTLTK